MGIYYTIQHLEEFKKFKEDGILKGQKEFVFEWDIEAYKWLIEQMDKRLGIKGSYPIWVWTKKPKLREKGLMEKGTPSVCIKLEIPDEIVLLSDFDAWHCVLNDWFCSLSENEPTSDNEVLKRKSWENIFDLKKVRDSEVWGGDKQWVQGVTPCIKKEQVLKVKHFIAK